MEGQVNAACLDGNELGVYQRHGLPWSGGRNAYRLGRESHMTVTGSWGSVDARWSAARCRPACCAAVELVWYGRRRRSVVIIDGTVEAAAADQGLFSTDPTVNKRCPCCLWKFPSWLPAGLSTPAQAIQLKVDVQVPLVGWWCRGGCTEQGRKPSPCRVPISVPCMMLVSSAISQ